MVVNHQYRQAALLILTVSPRIDTVSSPILQIRKLRPREVKLHAMVTELVGYRVGM